MAYVKFHVNILEWTSKKCATEMNIKVYVPDSKDESDNAICRRIIASIGNNSGQLMLFHDIHPDELHCGYIIRSSSSLADNVEAIDKCDAIL